jgi:hypothetical protein
MTDTVDQPELPAGLSYKQPAPLAPGLSYEPPKSEKQADFSFLNKPYQTPYLESIRRGTEAIAEIPQSVALGAMRGLAGAGQFAERSGSAIYDYAKSLFGDKTSDKTMSDIITNAEPKKGFSPSEWALNQINAEQERLENKTGNKYIGYIPKAAEFAGEALMNPLSRIMATPGLIGGASSGVAMGALSPTETGLSDKEYWERKKWDVGAGGILGGVFGKLLQAPDKDIQRLAEAGVKNLPLGFLGGAWSEAENLSKLLPFVRKPVEAAEQSALESFNRGVINKVLQPLGITAPKDMPVGHNLTEWVMNKIGDKYSEIAPKVQIDFTPTFEKQIRDKVTRLGRSMTTESREILAREVDDLFNNVGRVGVIPGTGQIKRILPGEAFREIESNLGSKANELMRSNNSGAARGLFSVQDMLRKELRNQNKPVANELRSIHDAYINSRPLQKVDEIITNELFTPGQLAQRTKKPKMRGVDNEIRDFAESAQRVMGSTGKTPELNAFIPTAIGLGATGGIGAAGLGGLLPHGMAALGVVPAGIIAGRAMQTQPFIRAANAIRQSPIEPYLTSIQPAVSPLIDYKQKIDQGKQ